MRRWTARVVGVAAVATLGLGVAPGTASAAPVNPSDGQLTAAQRAQQAAAAQVGQVTAALAQARAAAERAAADANTALQDYEDTQAAHDEARVAADAAAAAAAQAEVELQAGRDEVVAFARDSYMQGSTSAGARAFMTAGGPAQLLERAALLETVGEHRVDVVAQLTVLEEQATVADQAAQQAVQQAEALRAEAEVLLVSAQQQESAARSQAESLAEQQEQYAAGLASAEQTLAALQGQRAEAETFAAQQVAAQQRAATAERATSRPSSSSSGSASSSGSGSAGSGSSSGGSSSGGSSSRPAPVAVPAPPPATTVGAPSRSAVETAIAAAMSQRGVPYSWGGGNSNGPSYGIAPDTRVWGFDCSGLTQYAYAQAGISIGGTSRDQYWLNRGKTVAKGDLQRGDLLFWDNGSSNPNYLDIVHVAIYLGDGQMIEAPTSGSYVKVSTARTSSSTYFGAVRPAG